MTRSPLCLLPLLFACTARPPTTDETPDAGGEKPAPLILQVSGTVELYPAAVSYLQGLAQPLPSLESVTVRVEEPLKVALADPQGAFGSDPYPLSGGPAFVQGGIDVSQVSVGLAGAVTDPCTATTCVPRVIRSSTVLYDTVLTGRKPDVDLVRVKAYALPVSFHDQLTFAIGSGQIRALTGDEASTLATAGGVLGKVVDASGAPVVDAQVLVDGAAAPGALFYPSEDLSATQAATSASGLFLFVHAGGSGRAVRFTVEGRAEYRATSAVAVRGTCAVVTLAPGSP